MFTKTGFLMCGAVLCSVRIHLIVPCQATSTRTDVVLVQKSIISADNVLSAKNVNLGVGSYRRMVRGRKDRDRRALGSG